MAEEAITLGAGARGLHRLIGRAVDGVDHRWSELAERGVCKVVIGRACVEDGAAPELIEGEPAFPRQDEGRRGEALAGLPRSPKPVMESESELPPGISDVRGWSDAFERENKHRAALIHRLAEELRNRKATISEFFLSYVYADTENIQANLHYLDYRRLKKEEEARQREEE